MNCLRDFKNGRRYHIFQNLSIRNDYKLLSVMVVSTVATGLVPAVTSVLTGRVFDLLSVSVLSGAHHDLYPQLVRRSMAVMALGVASVPVMWLSLTAWMRIGERQGFRIRSQLLEAYLETKPMEWYDANETLLGDFTQVNRCVEELRSSSAEASAVTFQNLVAICALIGTSFYYSWSLTLIILCSSPVITVFAVIFSKMIHMYTQKENTETSKAAQLFTWSMNAAQLVRLYCTQPLERQKFQEIILSCNTFFIKSCLYVAANAGILRFLTLTMFVQGFWFGSTMIRKGKLNINDVITCFHSCIMLGSTLNNTLHQIVVLQKGEVALKKIMALLESNSKQNALNTRRHIQPALNYAASDLVFENVSFAYPSRPSETVLQKVNLRFPAGQFTFIVGKSGSGKSTISNLLLNFYDNYDGSILINGRNTQSIQRKSLISNITVVEQRCTLFNDTLKKNILLGSTGSIRNADTNIIGNNSIIKDACRMALLDRLILDLPDGLETLIGSGGVSLSGGQQQRVAIARAFIRDTPILFLDEAVSALDIVHRDLLMKAIRHWRKGKTTIILTHDLSQIESDDHLYVMQEGRVIESGIQSELLADSATTFSKWYCLQNDFSDAKTIINTETEEDSVYTTESFNSQLETPKLGVDLNKLEYSETDQLSFYETTHRQRSNYKTKRIRVEDEENVHTVKQENDIESSTGPQILSISAIIKRMIKDIRYKKILILGLLCSLIAGATNPVFSYTFSFLMEGIVPSTDGNTGSSFYLAKWSFIVLGVAAADGIFNFFKGFLLGHCSEYWIMDLRSEIMDKLTRKNMNWFSGESNKASEISALVLNDLRDLRSLVSEFLSAMTSFVTVSTIGLVWALISGWKLSLVCISMFPLIVIFSAIYGGILQNYETDYKTSVAQLENCLYQIMTSIKTIKCLQAEFYFQLSYHDLKKKMEHIAYKRAVATGFGISVTNMIALCIQAILYYYGLKLVLVHEYTSKKMFETFTLLLFTIMSCTSLIGQIPDISRGQRAASWIYRILDEEEDTLEIEDSDARALDISGAEYYRDKNIPIVSIRNLTFSYPSAPNVPIFKNMNLEMFCEQTMGIVGESGSGKSTLSLLLTRLYNCEANNIIIDGTDVNDWNLSSLRRQISVVEQKPSFFDGSIRDNLTYGCLGEMLEVDIYDVLKYVGIYDFVASLPHELDTRIDTNLLSGGQAQRLCIARALLRRSKILILDECTSALDSVSSHIINDLVRKGPPGLLTLVITHSEQMMRCCNSIAVLKHGKVVEKGNFDDLYNKEGELFRIVSNRS
ncbi:ATP-binding cassette alpha-factor transporter ste6 [Saccharomyces pastorianus]|uniref:ATP-binding cassette alpha-factor transporter ste6 n=1 Tax=Saccharomyces pastorianus TaxID=27292 RepID=A0A6C1EA95_SACPS|nr:ATP-binding cassette alpha-factor transporter ste6 [Saccharomyces pastorianus]